MRIVKVRREIRKMKKVRKREKALRKTFRVAMRLSPKGAPAPRGRHFVLRLETKSNIKDAFKNSLKRKLQLSVGSFESLRRMFE